MTVQKTKDRALTWEEARAATRPRACRVAAYERGGRLCCDLCAKQRRERLTVTCAIELPEDVSAADAWAEARAQFTPKES